MKIFKATQLFIGLMLFFVGSFVPLSDLEAQPDNIGTEFWLMFNQNIGSPNLSLFITAEVATTGSVDIPGIGFVQAFSVVPGAITTINIPIAAHITSNDVVGNKGIHVIANDQIAVYGLNQRQASTDAFLGIPVDVLSNEYLIMSYDNLPAISNSSKFGIVGTESNTNITIIPKATTGVRTAGVPYNITLNIGETYQLGASADLTGSEIISDKPIAVFGAHLCANVPQNTTFCDHLTEQMPPVNTWGKQFLTASLATRIAGDVFRILASVDGTVVSINGTVVATLNRGDFHEVSLPSNSFNEISSTQAVLVAQYSKGTSADGVNADPFMMIIPPFENFSGNASFTTPSVVFSTLNFVNIVAPNAGVGNILLDGVAIPATDFTAIAGTNFSGARIAISQASHNLTGTVPFGAFVYGFANFDSYGYPSGQFYSPVTLVNSLSVSPLNENVEVNTQHCVTASVTDQFGAGVQGIRVDFNVIGVNPSTNFVNTDANGEAEFCYTGANAGVDSIIANIGALTVTAAANWSACSINSILTAVCDSVNNEYTVTVGATGGTPPYTVTGDVTVTGVSTIPVPSITDGAIDITITDAAACTQVASINVPACSTQTGTGGGGIPTMSEWGLMILALLLLSFATSMAIAPNVQMNTTSGQGMGTFVFNKIPFVSSIYQKAFKYALLLTPFAFYAIYLIWSSVTTTDVIGMLIALPIFAHFLHLILIDMKK